MSPITIQLDLVGPETQSLRGDVPERLYMKPDYPLLEDLYLTENDIQMGRLKTECITCWQPLANFNTIF